MSHEQYLAHPALNNSTIKAMLQSPWGYEKMAGSKSEPTPAMQFGTLAHMVVLEPELFIEKVRYISKELKPTTNAYKEKKREYEQDGHLVITEAQQESLLDIQKSIVSHPEACELLRHGVSEVSCFWKEQDSDTLFKARCDFISSHNCIVDLKTTSGPVDADTFSRTLTVDNFGYALQAAHYTAFSAAALGEPVDFVWVLVQTKAPYEVAVFRATDMVLQYGHAWRQKGIDIYREAQASGRWPRRVEGICDIEMPAWAKFPSP